MTTPNNPQNPYESAVVRASAGSGKTYQLSRRFLYLVGAGANPSSILTVTFTKKAAAEMRARILDLAAKLLASPEEQASFEQGLKAFYAARSNPNAPHPLSAIETASRILASTQSLRISTIDSILLEWLRKFPYEASGEGQLRIPPRFDLMSMASEERIHRRSWFRTLRSMAEVKQRELSDVLQNPENLHVIDLENRLRELVKHESFLWLLKQERPHLDPLLKHAIDEDWGEGGEKTLVEALSPYFRQLGQILSKDRAIALGESLGGEDLSRLRAERFLTAEGKVHGGTFRSPKRDPYQTEIEAINRLCLSYLSFLLKHRLNTTGTLLMDVFKQYQDQASQLKFDEGSLSFADLIKGGYHLFSSPEAAGARYLLNRSIRHLLLDEFQDTSILQWTVFKSMAEEMLSGSGFRSVDELDPTLFIVGDAKQSIYGFREADAEILVTAAQFMVSREALDIELSASYRTHSMLLDFINQAMDPLIDQFPAHVAAAKDEVPLVRGHAAITISPLFTPRGEGLSPIEDEASYIAETLAARINSGHLVFDKQGDGYRPLRAADCAVLYRASTHARTYAAALRDRGLSVRIEEGQSFFQRPEISDLLAFCRLMAYPNDVQAAFQVLKSPLVAASEAAMLAALRNQKILVDNDASLKRSDQVMPLLEALGEASALLREVFLTRHDSRPYEVLQDFLARTQALSRYFQAFGAEEGTLAAANIQKFMELVLLTDQSAELSWMQVLRALRDKEIDESISLASVSEDAVQLMTIHKAKGLEWPLVVLTGTGEEWEKADLYWAKLKDSGLGTGLAYVGKRSELTSDDPHFASLAKALTDEALRENYRLLYVALTRAQFELVVTGYQRRAKAETSYFHGLLRATAKSMGFGLETDGQTLTLETHDDLPLAPETIREAGSESLSFLETWAPHRIGETGIRILAPARLLGEKEVFTPGAASLPFPAEAGTYIHKALESSIRGDELPFEEYWQTLRRHHPEDLFARAWPIVEAETNKVLNSAPWSDLRARALKFSAAPEMPIAYLKDNMLVRGIIDLLIQEDEKSWLIVDYKTGQDALDHQGDLLGLAQAKNYDKQLELYKEGVKRLYPSSEVRTAIFFTALQELVYIS